VVTLRPYQEAAIEAVREKIRSGKRRVLLVIATGGGKTYTAGKIIENTISKNKKAIFLAHRTELIEQCSDTLKKLNIDHGIIKSGYPKNRMKSVQVASIQTLIRRDHWDADLIVIDEAHRSVAKTYIKIIKRYKNNTIILGLTATPYRMDGRGLAKKIDENGNEKEFGYDSLVEVIETQKLVEQGFLIEPTVFGCANPDLTTVDIKGSTGDYDSKSASKAMQKTIMHGDLLTNWARICGNALGSQTTWIDIKNGAQSDIFINNNNQKVLNTNCDAITIAFLPSVEDSKKIAEQFKLAGVKAEHLDGDTSPKIRSQILNALKHREICLVTNCEILNEGYDLPHLECVIGARPTISKSLFKQMVGRLMRPDDNKRIAYLLDHANWTRMHGYVTDLTIHSLDGKEKRPRKGDALISVKECPQCRALLSLLTKICIECGYEFPAKELIFTNEDLIELNKQKIKKVPVIPIEIRQQAFNRLAVRCVEERRNPKQAKYLYFKEFGEWPTIETGIKIPRFFWQYESIYNKQKLSKNINIS
jgi:superfamily II DNA or RNA helicase